jgi:anti-sigma B factor antagonist
MTNDQQTADGVLATAVVPMPPEIDIANASRLAAELDGAIKPGVTALVIDMTFTTFCDSQGVNVIAQTQRRAEAEGVDLRVVTASPQVLRVLQVTALDTVVGVYRHLADAIYPG